MLDLFYEGGTLFMGLLTILFLLIVVQAVRTRLRFTGGSLDVETARRMMSYVRSLGILAFVVGVLGQLIGLFQAFEAIQDAGGVSPNMLIGGIRVTLITTIYGTLILVVSLVLWLILDSGLKSRTTDV